MLRVAVTGGALRRCACSSSCGDVMAARSPSGGVSACTRTRAAGRVCGAGHVAARQRHGALSMRGLCTSTGGHSGSDGGEGLLADDRTEYMRTLLTPDCFSREVLIRTGDVELIQQLVVTEQQDLKRSKNIGDLFYNMDAILAVNFDWRFQTEEDALWEQFSALLGAKWSRLVRYGYDSSKALAISRRLGQLVHDRRRPPERIVSIVEKLITDCGLKIEDASPAFATAACQEGVIMEPSSMPMRWLEVLPQYLASPGIKLAPFVVMLMIMRTALPSSTLRPLVLDVCERSVSAVRKNNNLSAALASSNSTDDLLMLLRLSVSILGKEDFVSGEFYEKLSKAVLSSCYSLQPKQLASFVKSVSQLPPRCYQPTLAADVADRVQRFRDTRSLPPHVLVLAAKVTASHDFAFAAACVRDAPAQDLVTLYVPSVETLSSHHALLAMLHDCVFGAARKNFTVLETLHRRLRGTAHAQTLCLGVAERLLSTCNLVGVLSSSLDAQKGTGDDSSSSSSTEAAITSKRIDRATATDLQIAVYLARNLSPMPQWYRQALSDALRNLGQVSFPLFSPEDVADLASTLIVEASIASPELARSVAEHLTENGNEWRDALHRRPLSKLVRTMCQMPGVFSDALCMVLDWYVRGELGQCDTKLAVCLCLNAHALDLQEHHQQQQQQHCEATQLTTREYFPAVLTRAVQTRDLFVTGNALLSDPALRTFIQQLLLVVWASASTASHRKATTETGGGPAAAGTPGADTFQKLAAACRQVAGIAETLGSDASDAARPQEPPLTRRQEEFWIATTALDASCTVGEWQAGLGSSATASSGDATSRAFSAANTRSQQRSSVAINKSRPGDQSGAGRLVKFVTSIFRHRPEQPERAGVNAASAASSQPVVANGNDSSATDGNAAANRASLLVGNVLSERSNTVSPLDWIRSSELLLDPDSLEQRQHGGGKEEDWERGHNDIDDTVDNFMYDDVMRILSGPARTAATHTDTASRTQSATRTTQSTGSTQSIASTHSVASNTDTASTRLSAAGTLSIASNTVQRTPSYTGTASMQGTGITQSTASSTMQSTGRKPAGTLSLPAPSQSQPTDVDSLEAIEQLLGVDGCQTTPMVGPTAMTSSVLAQAKRILSDQVSFAERKRRGAKDVQVPSAHASALLKGILRRRLKRVEVLPGWYSDVLQYDPVLAEFHAWMPTGSSAQHLSKPWQQEILPPQQHHQHYQYQQQQQQQHYHSLQQHQHHHQQHLQYQQQQHQQQQQQYQQQYQQQQQQQQHPLHSHHQPAYNAASLHPRHGRAGGVGHAAVSGSGSSSMRCVALFPVTDKNMPSLHIAVPSSLRLSLLALIHQGYYIVPVPLRESDSPQVVAESLSRELKRFFPNATLPPMVTSHSSYSNNTEEGGISSTITRAAMRSQ